METVEILACIILVAISGFISSSEIALFSLSKFQLKAIKDRFRGSHKNIRKLLSDPSGLLVTVLIANEIVNVALSTIITRSAAGDPSNGVVGFLNTLFLKVYSGNVPAWIVETLAGILITAPVFLILCELTPKVLGARANTLIAPLVATPLKLLYHLVTPVRLSIQFLLNRMLALIPAKRREVHREGANDNRLKEEDFLMMVEEAHRDGDVQSTELQLIRSVFDMDDTPVIQITTPINRVFSLQQGTSLQTAIAAMKDEARSQTFSRIPIYGKIRSDVTGILYSKDLLIAKLEKYDLHSPVSELMRKPFSVSANTHLSSVFRKMKKQRTHMAIVTGDKGNAIGVVTMNDVLKALLDELFEEESFAIGALK